MFHGRNIRYCRVYISQRKYKAFVARNVYNKPLNLNFPLLELYRFIYCSYISGYIIQLYVSFTIKCRAVNFKNSLGTL
jgi:hypothetical protein